jgi:hypothetical protein
MICFIVSTFLLLSTSGKAIAEWNQGQKLNTLIICQNLSDILKIAELDRRDIKASFLLLKTLIQFSRCTVVDTSITFYVNQVIGTYRDSTQKETAVLEIISDLQNYNTKYYTLAWQENSVLTNSNNQVTKEAKFYDWPKNPREPSI